jgi:ABC-type dipeptide/oligopeptide/nickel transport system permease subunit
LTFHVLPNLMTVVVTVASLRLASIILTAAALNFFGLGVQPPTAEWGLMIASGRQFYSKLPMLMLVPGICVFALSLGANLFSDGIRDWLDPRAAER